jgi:penicillin-binding protein 2
MYQRPEDRARPSRKALRIAVVGGVAVTLFAILFFRLWTLQILEGSENLAQAKNNRTRSFKIIAPRGKILTRNGEVLVDNRTSLALQVDTTKLPEDPPERTAELRKLGSLVHMKIPRVEEVIEEEEEVAAGAPITLRRDVGYDLIYYIEEHKGQFPGVSVEKVFVRNYPDEDAAAQVVGHVGEVDAEELEEGPYKGIEPGEVVGKEGIEYSYDKFLRGTPGTSRYQVNALGEPTPGGRLASTPPQAGDNLKLSINPAVQAAGEAALAERGLPGAFVSMNIHTGEILGMGSNPTYDPSVWTKPLTPKEYELLSSEENGTPIFNRAIESAYPTGSTYKIITALAALENNFITGNTVIDDNGFIELGGEKFENSEGEINGPISLVHALQVSSDVFFYRLGEKMNGTNDLQDWSHKLGIGDPSGIDIPDGFDGNVPSRKWRDELFEAGETERPWSVGDNVQLATGQGDLQTDPLQMAIAYAALGNGGTIVTPHLGMEIQDAVGRALREIDPGPRRHVDIDPHSQQMIMEGLHEAAQVPGGTAAPVFEEFPIEIAGKTGTAERAGQGNQSWFISLAPYPNPNVVTVVTIEQGGFGAEAAAPANKQILEAYFHNTLKKETEEKTKEETGATTEIENGESLEYQESFEGEVE